MGMGGFLDSLFFIMFVVMIFISSAYLKYLRKGQLHLLGALIVEQELLEMWPYIWPSIIFGLVFTMIHIFSQNIPFAVYLLEA